MQEDTGLWVYKKPIREKYELDEDHVIGGAPVFLNYADQPENKSLCGSFSGIFKISKKRWHEMLLKFIWSTYVLHDPQCSRAFK